MSAYVPESVTNSPLLSTMPLHWVRQVLPQKSSCSSFVGEFSWYPIRQLQPSEIALVSSPPHDPFQNCLRSHLHSSVHDRPKKVLEPPDPESQHCCAQYGLLSSWQVSDVRGVFLHLQYPPHSLCASRRRKLQTVSRLPSPWQALTVRAVLLHSC